MSVATAGAPPAILPLNVENLPLDDLAPFPRCVTWDLEWRDGTNGKPGGWTKVPKNPRTGANARSNTSATWGTPEDVLSRYDRFGFVVAKDDPFCFLDIDNGIDPNTDTIKPWAQSIVDRFPSAYWERSTTGTGLKGLVRGRVPRNRIVKVDDGQIELFASGKFTALTGNRLVGSSPTIGDGQAALNALYAELCPEPTSRTSQTRGAGQLALSDEDVIARARDAANGPKFLSLWAGDTSAYGGDDSAADLALLSILAYWTQDEDQLNRLFRRSGLDRAKWRRTDYRLRTIKRALQRDEIYEPAGVTIHRPGRNGVSAGADTGNNGQPTTMVHADEPIIAGIRCSDLGNAEKLADRLDGRFRSVPASKTWRIYRDGRWQPDVYNAVAQEAIHSILDLYGRLADVEDAKERKRLRDHIHRSESQRAIQAAVSVAMTDPRIATAESDFDAKPGLLNVRNGTIELATNRFREHDPADLLTKQAPVNFDPEAEAPTWRRFIADIMPNEAQRDWLQLYFGYAAAGDPVEQVVAMAYGEGQNGKSTMIDVLCGVMGPYAMRSDIETFLTQRNNGGGSTATPDLARLPGVRFLFAAEPGAGRRLNAGRVKEISGGENIVARHLWGAPFEFTPQFNLWISTNKKPVVPGNDPALWRRLRLIPFTVRVPEERRVLGLANTILKKEAPGVLNWILEGLQVWREIGRLPSVESIRQATEDYRTESDEVGQFILQRCQIGQGLRVPATELYLEFVRWFGKEIGGKPPTQTMFGRDLNDRGLESCRDGVTYRMGLALLPEPSVKREGEG